MEDWLAHISPSKCGRLFYNLGVLSPRTGMQSEPLWAQIL